MTPAGIRAMARTIYGTDCPKGNEARSWLEHGRMSSTQRKRLGQEDKPPCFESETQWIAWCIYEAANHIHGENGYCHDCTLRYQQRMIEYNRCAFPLTTFVRVRQSSTPIGRRNGRRRATTPDEST